MSEHSTELKQTPLHALHLELGAKMVPFAGYSMPVQYPMGVMAEHLHTRAHAGLFDVSHMGQVILTPKHDMAALEAGLEALMPVAVSGLAEGRQRYGMFTNAQGGILDDLMFANRGDHLFMVVNAACKAEDIAHMQAHLADVAQVQPVSDRALLALQGPQAETALAALVPDVRAMRFMDVLSVDTLFGALWISRSGYTGEDGFEISVPATTVADFARLLLDRPEVAAIGLGARDSLRLEAGLCLYGHDIDTTTTPTAAGLAWTIAKRRREAGDFPGAARILAEMAEGAPQRLVGLTLEGRLPAREGALIFAGDEAVGRVTSGGFAPTVGAPIALGYVDAAHAAVGTDLVCQVRQHSLKARVTALPFVPHNYRR